MWRLAQDMNVDGTETLNRGTVIDPNIKNFAFLKRMKYVYEDLRPVASDVAAVIERGPASRTVSETASVPPVVDEQYDLTSLDGSVRDLADAVEWIEDGNHLRALLDAEEGGKTRSSAVVVIRERLDAINLNAVGDGGQG